MVEAEMVPALTLRVEPLPMEIVPAFTRPPLSFRMVLPAATVMAPLAVSVLPAAMSMLV